MTGATRRATSPHMDGTPRRIDSRAPPAARASHFRSSVREFRETTDVADGTDGNRRWGEVRFGLPHRRTESVTISVDQRSVSPPPSGIRNVAHSQERIRTPGKASSADFLAHHFLAFVVRRSGRFPFIRLTKNRQEDRRQENVAPTFHLCRSLFRLQLFRPPFEHSGCGFAALGAFVSRLRIRSLRPRSPAAGGRSAGGPCGRSRPRFATAGGPPLRTNSS